jgi:anti-sigma factor RsiW
MNEKDLQTLELLPWYAAGTLSDSERAEVEDFLERHPEHRRDVAELRALVETEVMLSQQAPELDPGLFDKAMAEIEAYENARQPGAEPAAGWLDALRSWWTVTPSLSRAVMAAQFALLLGVAGLFLTLQQPPDSTTLGGTVEPAAGPRVSVQFAATATEAAIRGALGEVGAEIVAGPSALGLYTIALPEDADAEAALGTLRANAAVVIFAELSP